MSIPKDLPTGKNYKAIVLERVGEGEETEVSSFDFYIPEKETLKSNSIIEPETPVTHTTGDVNLALLLQLRDQDRIAHENERQLWETKLESVRSLYEAEIKRLNESRVAEIDRINKDWEYKLEITKNNQVLLEAERTKLTKAIESRIKGELKNGNTSEGFDLTKALENPLVLSILGKTLGLEVPNIPTGNGGGIDVAQIMQLASGFINQTPAGGQKNSIMEILNRGK
ncbi:hypothetical protein LEP1GSC193_1686 [Leptospira alstonii serovar Pingchang str. 80-412]|uniref:Uncharacterized protein n=2 Tax=Leptospira alstonii TaxID=28452 RepID=M6D264_9LEPT|nr:hypothetical protein LEP1GSC194_4300 [Leptospira alstonii serovar Sichuan str. 79601]EQA78752.1 hypothetical protein LEP1GSC193_1686 [Leptospira alstonii serovar Pingchang str. 80-412]